MARKRRKRPDPDDWPDGRTVRRRLCEHLGLADWVPDEVLADMVSEKLDAWEANEAEAGLPHVDD